MDERTSQPISSKPPIIASMMTMLSAAMVVWLTPISICGIAEGNSTCQNCCHCVQPLISPASSQCQARGNGHRDRPGQPLKRGTHRAHRLIQQSRNASEERLEYRDEEIGETVDPGRNRQDPVLGIDDEPGK